MAGCSWCRTTPPVEQAFDPGHNTFTDTTATFPGSEGLRD